MNAVAQAPPVRGLLRHNEPMAAHTSWRVGGPADTYFEPADRADLIAFITSLPHDRAVFWLGLGSNLLVRDGGIRGIVIALHGALEELKQDDAVTIYAEAGVHCARLAKFATQKRRAGLGFMAGIPGTVGGALAMNAGAWGGETWPAVREAEVLFRDGRSEWLKPASFVARYRHVEMPAAFCGFLAARFAVSEDTGGEHERHTKASLAKRKATQPVGKPSAGSTFRNPPGDHAARLIEVCGLKSHRIGGAEVSSLHANFIVTNATAKAADVEALIAHVRDVVKQKTGIELMPEVKIVGEHK